jgi:hypothetical protein
MRQTSVIPYDMVYDISYEMTHDLSSEVMARLSIREPGHCLILSEAKDLLDSA